VRKSARIVTFVWLVVLMLSACGPTKKPQAQVVESYLNALVAKDENRLSTIACAEWEPDALLELDSLQGVEARLEGMACSVVGTEGTTTLVKCQGKLIATYTNENQELDLSVRTYQVVQQGGDYLVCGTR
jgi:hypothetical protein